MRVIVSLIVGAALCVVGCDHQTTSSSGGGGGDHRARVVLEVRPPVENAELYIATQAELVKSDAVLAAAAEKLGKKTDDLASMVTSARVGESSLIEVVVNGGDETESAETANAVANAFVEWAASEEEARVVKRYEELQKQIDDQKEKLEEARVKMLDVMGEANSKKGRAPAWLIDEGVLAELRATIAALEGLEGDELIDTVVELGVSAEPVKARHSEYQNMKLVKAKLRSSGLAAKHPKVIATERQLTQLELILLEAVEAAKGALKTQLAMSEQSLENRAKLEQQLAAEAAKRSQDDVEYDEVKAAYEREKKRLEVLDDTEVSAPAAPPAVLR